MKERQAFTLVELLVSMAILGVLAAMLLPAVQQARESARRVQCTHHLRQLALAAHHYHGSHGSFPPGLNQFESTSAPRFRGTSLLTFLLPQIEQGSLAASWNYSDPLANTAGGPNARSATVLPLLICPSDIIAVNPSQRGGLYYGLTSYGGNGGARSYFPDFATADGVFHTTGPASHPRPQQAPVRLADILDGTSSTLLFGERSHVDANYESFSDAGWTDSLRELGAWSAIGGRRRIGDVTMSAFAPLNYRLPFDFSHRDAANPPATPATFAYYHDLRVCAWGSNHPNGANFALADGSARFVSDAVSPLVVRALSTRSGNETALPW